MISDSQLSNVVVTLGVAAAVLILVFHALTRNDLLKE